MAADRLPQSKTPTRFCNRSAEESAACFVDLVDRECQEHQQCQHCRELPFTMPIIVFQMIALVLKRIEDFVLNSLTSTPIALIQIQTLLNQIKIGHPRERSAQRPAGSPAW